MMAKENDAPVGASPGPPTLKIWSYFAIIACFVAVWLVFEFTLSIRGAWGKMVRLDCQHNLRQIGLMACEYAGDHGGNMPSSWVELNFVGEYTNWARILRCPATRHEIGIWKQVDLWADYRLLPGRSTNDPPATILALEPLANHGSLGANVLFVDGSTAWWPASRVLDATSGIETNRPTK